MTGLKRLQTIAEMIIPNKPVADIGADHAWLALYLVENNLVSRAIVTELHEGPFKRAYNRVNESEHRDRIKCYQGDGLQVLQPAEVDTVVIAGMGGNNIIDILSSEWIKALSYRRFILQPMSRPHLVRMYLSRWGWPILEEKLIRENKRYFVIISTQPGKTPYNLSALEMDVGPNILKDNSEYKEEYLRSWKKKYTAVYNNIIKAKQSGKGNYLEILKEKLNQLEEILNGNKG